MRLFSRSGTAGWYSVTNGKILLPVFCLLCRTNILPLNLMSERVLPCVLCEGFFKCVFQVKSSFSEVVRLGL